MLEQELIEQGYRKYAGEDIDVYFNLEMCIHSGVCTRGLPHVFDVSKKPWVNTQGDSAEAIAHRIRKCPSGALQYSMKNGFDLRREENRVCAYRDNQEVGGVTFTKAGESLLIIDHTFVDESMKGQKLGKKLVSEVVEVAREQEKKIVPLCPFAKAEFEKTPEYADVLHQ